MPDGALAAETQACSGDGDCAHWLEAGLGGRYSEKHGGGSRDTVAQVALLCGGRLWSKTEVMCSCSKDVHMSATCWDHLDKWRGRVSS